MPGWRLSLEVMMSKRLELTPEEYRQAAEQALGKDAAKHLSTVKDGIIYPLGKELSDVPKLNPISASDLDDLELPPIEWILEGILPHGVSIFGAPSKYFKSYLVLGACAAIAEGKSYLGFKSNKCDCLYFDLESTKRRPKERLNQIVGSGNEKPKGLQIITGDSKICKLGKGFEQQLSALLDENQNIKLVVIDVFGKIRLSKGKMDQYEYDYRDITALKAIADKYDIAILLVHHTTKEKRSDPFDSITGSVGLVGAADCAWTITKENRTATSGVFHITGRDMETQEINVSFNKDNFTWERQPTTAEMEYKQLCSDYEKSNTVKTIFTLTTIPGYWKGSLNDLIRLSYQNNTPIALDARAVGLELNRFRDLLEIEGITFSKVRDSKGMIYTFKTIKT